MDQVTVICTDNNRVISANFVSKTDKTLVAYWREADMRLTMSWNGMTYVFNKLGYEFTSDGKISKSK